MRYSFFLRLHSVLVQSLYSLVESWDMDGHGESVRASSLLGSHILDIVGISSVRVDSFAHSWEYNYYLITVYLIIILLLLYYTTTR